MKRFITSKMFRLLTAAAFALTFYSRKDTSYLDIDPADRPPLRRVHQLCECKACQRRPLLLDFHRQGYPIACTDQQSIRLRAHGIRECTDQLCRRDQYGYKASCQFGNSATFIATGRPNGPIATFLPHRGRRQNRQQQSRFADPLYDDLKAPASGKAKLRFINLSPCVGALHVVRDGKPLFSNVGYGRAANSALTGETLSAWSLGPFETVDAGKYHLDLIQVKDQVKAGSSSIQLKAGKIYTVFTRGHTTGSCLNSA